MELTQQKLYTKKDILNLFQISLGTLDGMIKRKEINYLKFGNGRGSSVRFTEDDINNLCNKSRVVNEY